jgi:hypothetical protein
MQGGVYISVCGLENAIYFVNKVALCKRKHAGIHKKKCVLQHSFVGNGYVMK